MRAEKSTAAISGDDDDERSFARACGHEGGAINSVTTHTKHK